MKNCVKYKKYKIQVKIHFIQVKLMIVSSHKIKREQEILKKAYNSREVIEKMGKIPQEQLGQVKTCDELLLEFQAKDKRDNSSKIKFAEKEKDVYNISAPFADGEQVYIAGRVESRDSEQSNVVFFKQEGDVWVPETGVEPLELQDPFITRIGGKLIIGGVQILQMKKNLVNGIIEHYFIKEIQFAH